MKVTNNLKVQIPTKHSYSYDILIGENLLENINSIISNYTKSNKFLIVTNETVYNIFKNKIEIGNSRFILLPDGEEHKNIDNFKKILDAAVEFKLERTDCIISFGGGVVGDIAGYAASSYMRGIDYIQIPTTLLAQVDSSVGGKVAINHEHGKNLIGAFYQPKVVIMDTSTLKSLPIRQLKTGLAEVLKYAFIEKSCETKKSFNLYDFLKENKEKIYELDAEIISELIYICCQLKASVVEKDETEKGLRAILNFGHTFAHAIENLTNYTKYTHGEAVAIGMKKAFKLSKIKKLINDEYYDKAIELIDTYKLSDDMPEFDFEKFYNEMFLDKKAQNGKIRFVLSDGQASVGIYNDLTKDDVENSLK